MGGVQLLALSAIASAPGIGVGALARAMDVRQSTASNLVKSLIAQGYIELQQGGRDGRRHGRQRGFCKD